MMQMSIVAQKDKDNQVFATKLQNLITEKLIAAEYEGPEFKTVVWTEEQYRNQKPEMTQNNLVVFVGKSKEQSLLEETGDFTNNYASEYLEELGMKYSWRGTKAELIIDEKKFANANVGQVINMFERSGLTIPANLEGLVKKSPAYDENQSIKINRTKFDAKLFNNLPDAVKRFERPISVAILGLASFSSLTSVAALSEVVTKIKTVVKLEQLVDEAYKILVTDFVDNGLSDFLNSVG